jgi:hypothetical protein
MGNLTARSLSELCSKRIIRLKSFTITKKLDIRRRKILLTKVENMINKKVGKLEIVFIDKEGKWYPIDEVDREDLADGLEKVSKEVAKRLQLLKDQR